MEVALEPKWPSREWFFKWRETLLLTNIKSSIQHTYNKSMAYRNQMIETDLSYSANQIVNIDEDALATYLKKFSLKGLLPKIPNILVTTYRGNQSIDTWLISYLWGLVFIFAQEYQMFEPRFFRLFSVNNYSQGVT